MRGILKLSVACWRPAKLWLLIVAGGLAATARANTFVVTTTANSGPGSFFQAITNANASPGLDTITFNLSGTPPFTIAPTTALPAITDPVVIDATTQPGYAGKPVIELNGAATSGSTIGLRFSSGASTLRGLAINRFPVQQLELDSASNTVQGNFIGTDVTGTLARGKGSGSYGLLVKSADNLIGGTNAGNGNVFSGGNDTGIYLLNANSNVVQGNLIGVTAAGTASLSNLNNGIVIYGSSGNLIGGPVPAAMNIVSGNGASGVYLTGAATTGNVIQGNRIGTDISGSNAVSNVKGDGVTIIGAPGNVVSGNLISSNGSAGVSIQNASATGNVVSGNYIGTDVNGKIALANHNSGVSISGGGGNQIGGTNAGAGNVISGNIFDGITLTGGTTANLIQGNLIGLTAAGGSALHNGQNGITISSATNNTIGGVVAGARNVISGNAGNGIDIAQLADSGNRVLGNYIGTDVAGAVHIPNNLAGVLLQGSTNIIGGTVAGAGNVISGNLQQGVWIVGANGNVTGNVVQGNLIGLNASGTASVGNGILVAASAGIGISTAAGNIIGGAAAGARNVISANNGAGIFLIGATASRNLVAGNFIGTDISGTKAVGNIWEGIYLEQAGTNQIGGSSGGAGNLISGNYAQGIFLTNASWNIIQGNWVGTKADGTNNLANQLHNVELQLNANNNSIGGAAAGAGNRLAYASVGYSQLYCGVRVRTGAGNNLISGNSIFSNGALGIDLSPTAGGTAAGVNPIVLCESGVAANAANAGQNYPTLSNVFCGASTRVRGSLSSNPGRTYTLQFFASPAGNASGYGEGQVFLGQTNLTLGSSCSSNFIAYLSATVPAGWVVTATATDPNNNTSEFSAWIPVITMPTVQLAQPGQGQLSVSWTNNGGSYALQQTHSLTPPILWSTVTNLPVLTSNFWVTTLGTTNLFASPVTFFFRLMEP
jgi:titin